MIVQIIIPSKGRAGSVLTKKRFPPGTFIITVEECEVEEYRKRNPDCEIVGHPDGLNIAEIRQWCYEQYGSMFMIDDDVLEISWIDYMSGGGTKLQPEEVVSNIVRIAEIAQSMGAFLFGFGKVQKPQQYRPERPFFLKGFVIAGAFGLLKGSRLWYNPECSISEDIWLSALNAYYHRFVFVDSRIRCRYRKTWTSPGGNASQRNEDREQYEYELLRRFFGDAIRLKVGSKKVGTATNFQMYVKQLELPY